MLDALVEACHRLQSADLLPEAHGAVPRLTLTMSLDDLQRQSGLRRDRDRRTALRLRGPTDLLRRDVIPTIVG